MRKILFIDRDGTIIKEPPDKQIDSLEKLEFYPGVICGMKAIAETLDYQLVMVTNQDGLGTELFPEDTFWPVHNKMLTILKNEGVSFEDILIDISLPQDQAPTRKPRTGLLKEYLKDPEIDWQQSYVIGDRESDVQLALNLGCQAIYLHEKKHPEAVLTTTDWMAIHHFLRSTARQATVQRRTAETDIRATVKLDGKDASEIETGIGFLNHMLNLFTTHSGIDLSLQASGDLEVDEHHTVEDTALVLGEAINKALDNKAGIERYGFLLPMDESLTQVALDFSGRPELVWQVEFQREYVGKMPTELFQHFFKSLTNAAGLTLHIKASGENEHHKIESIFKAVARAFKMAIHRQPDNTQIPSTKGRL